jgi:hypothetical protein
VEERRGCGREVRLAIQKQADTAGIMEKLLKSARNSEK